METRKYADRAQYLIDAVAKRRRRLREMALEYKGGKCVFCGYAKCSKALDFHHLGDKKFGLSERGLTRSWEIIKAELDKCILVCANCHRELHAGLLQLPTQK
jgi:hypothetical protein